MQKIIYDIRVINKLDNGVLDNVAFVRDSKDDEDVFIDVLLFYLDGLISLYSRDKDKLMITNLLLRIIIILSESQKIVYKIDFSLSRDEILDKIKQIFELLNISLSLVKESSYPDLYRFLNNKSVVNV
jgi:hypothetical protein